MYRAESYFRQMNTIDEIRQKIVYVVNGIYMRPTMYGPTPLELERTFDWFHWLWAGITDKQDELYAIKLELTPPNIRSLTGSFTRVLLHTNENATEAEQIAFVCSNWRRISAAVGIDLSESEADAVREDQEKV